MGLMVHSLDNIPESAKRDYFIYLLDYGWSEPIGDTLRNSFDKMAHESAINKAVIIKGTVGAHFQNEVFSWHQINGISGDEICFVRFVEHNAGKSVHTNKFKPWRLATYVAFSDHARADTFELYLKTSSGRTFAKRHF